MHEDDHDKRKSPYAQSTALNESVRHVCLRVCLEERSLARPQTLLYVLCVLSVWVLPTAFRPAFFMGVTNCFGPIQENFRTACTLKRDVQRCLTQ